MVINSSLTYMLIEECESFCCVMMRLLIVEVRKHLFGPGSFYILIFYICSMTGMHQHYIGLVKPSSKYNMI